jgi:hypothetical protein
MVCIQAVLQLEAVVDQAAPFMVEIREGSLGDSVETRVEKEGLR